MRMRTADEGNPGLAPTRDLIGYIVLTADGPAGIVDGASETIGNDHVIIRCGTGHLRRLLPAGTIDLVNHATCTIRLRLTRQELEDIGAHA